MLSPQVCYAVKALVEVIQAGDQAVPVHDIAERTGVPQAFLSKIVQRLARKGFVATRRGVGGGVEQAPDRPLEGVSLLELCEALDDPAVAERCLIGEADCSNARACPAHEFWEPQRHRLIEFLKSATLLDVARFEIERAQPE